MKKIFLFCLLILGMSTSVHAQSILGKWTLHSETVARLAHKKVLAMLEKTPQGKQLLQTPQGKKHVLAQINVFRQMKGEMTFSAKTLSGWFSFPGKKQKDFTGTWDKKGNGFVLKTQNKSRKKSSSVIRCSLSNKNILTCSEKKAPIQLFFHR